MGKFNVEEATRKILEEFNPSNAEEHIFRNHNRELAKSFGTKSDVYKKYSIKSNQPKESE